MRLCHFHGVVKFSLSSDNFSDKDDEREGKTFLNARQGDIKEIVWLRSAPEKVSEILIVGTITGNVSVFTCNENVIDEYCSFVEPCSKFIGLCGNILNPGVLSEICSTAFVSHIRARIDNSFVVAYGNGCLKYYSSFSSDSAVIITSKNVSH